MKKKDQILNAMHALLREGHAGTASVQDIATKAGIAKGGMYYYFKSKEEVLDALVEREYSSVIERCKDAVNSSDSDTFAKLKLLLGTYRGSSMDASLDHFLHLPENAAIHQKSLAHISTALSPILADILRQGVRENVFICDAPEEYADIMLSVLVFSLDAGLFPLTMEIALKRLSALADLLETGLHAPKGSFSFLYEGWAKLKLTDP